MKKITVVFPMAGEGQRFGNKFKPFLKIFNKTFIELAIDPFLKHADNIKRMIFIVREDHSRQFDVIHKIRDLNLPVPSSVIVVEPTKSVIETISPLFDEKKYLQDVIFCDCDHSLDVTPLFEEILKDRSDSILPGWNIEPKDSKKWSIAAVDDSDIVTAIEEKKYPEGGSNFYGIIGCYYFRRIHRPPDDCRYLSDVIRLMLSKKVRLVLVYKAEFFGDPERLENLYISKNASTVFCDLDGTLIEHENIPDYTRGIKLLPGAREKIDEWRAGNAFIVLTTSRDEQFRDDMEKLLREAGIRFEYLVMGLPPGPRFLINDKKPYSDKVMAKAIEVERNVGIQSIGHSFASFKVEKNTGRKSIPDDAPLHQREKFLAQYSTMRFLRSVIPCLVPKVKNFTGTSYDIEFLKDHRGLHQHNSEYRTGTLKRLFQLLEKLYQEKAESYPQYWLLPFFEEKIRSKQADIEKLNQSSTIISRLYDMITGHYKELSPFMLCKYFHGDLTYENILEYGGDIKLIDFDNDFLPGPPELDMGKLMQSILTGYESWDSISIFHYSDNEYNTVMDFYSKYLNQPRELVEIKARFYCVLHLIRMIPYQAKTSRRRARIALEWAEILLNEIKWNTSIKIS